MTDLKTVIFLCIYNVKFCNNLPKNAKVFEKTADIKHVSLKFHPFKGLKWMETWYIMIYIIYTYSITMYISMRRKRIFVHKK